MAGVLALAGSPPAAVRTKTFLKAELSVRQEVPKPLDTGPRARGSLTATFTQKGKSAQLT